MKTPPDTAWATASAATAGRSHAPTACPSATGDVLPMSGRPGWSASMSRRVVVAGLVPLVLLPAACATAPPPQYQVSHILCATEADAWQALRRVQAGEAFEKVAAEVSLDTGTRARGGRIVHWTAADDWTPAFAAEVKRLRVGEVSARPVKTEFGWHLLRVDAIRP